MEYERPPKGRKRSTKQETSTKAKKEHGSLSDPVLVSVVSDVTRGMLRQAGIEEREFISAMSVALRLYMFLKG